MALRMDIPDSRPYTSVDSQLSRRKWYKLLPWLPVLLQLHKEHLLIAGTLRLGIHHLYIRGILKDCYDYDVSLPKMERSSPRSNPDRGNAVKSAAAGQMSPSLK